MADSRPFDVFPFLWNVGFPPPDAVKQHGGVWWGIHFSQGCHAQTCALSHSWLKKTRACDRPHNRSSVSNVHDLGSLAGHVIACLHPDQWPLQDPKLEVPTTYKTYVRPM